MPSDTHTPRQTVRVDKELWEAFGKVADPDRSTVLRDFIRWYTGEVGAKMPRRRQPQ